jgi:hypothetical protein
MAQRSIENALGGPDMTQDDRVQTRLDELTQEAADTLEAIRALAPDGIADPLVNAAILTRAVQTGILDAPQLKNNIFGRGQIVTRIDKRGACIAIDPTTRHQLNERDRIETLIDSQ